MTNSQTKKSKAAIHKTQMAHKSLGEAITAIEAFAQENLEFANWVIELALEEGMEPKNANLPNAIQKINSRLKEARVLEDKAVELGYSSLPNALKALKMMSDRIPESANNLPDVFSVVPQIWLKGLPDTKRTTGFKPMTLRAAVRELKSITPLLAEAWELADDEARAVITKEFLSTSAESFKQEVYKFINEHEEQPLEEELIDMLDKRYREEKFAEWQASNAKNRR